MKKWKKVLKVLYLVNGDKHLEVNKLVNPILVYQPKPYYPRRSPIDLQIEEPLQHSPSYNGNKLQEWNIDGLSNIKLFVSLKIC